MARMDGALADAGLERRAGCCCRSTTSWCSKCPTAQEEAAAAVIRQVMADAAEPAMKLDVPLDVEVGWGAHWGEAH